MYNLDNRYEKLLGFLFSQNELVSIEEIAKQIGVAKTTVWRDLNFLTSILPNGWKIEKDEVCGVLLQEPQEGTLENLWSELRKHDSYFQVLRLILFNDRIMSSQITELFDTSRTTVFRQLKVISEILEKDGIKLVSKPYRLIGDEKKIRSICLQFLELMDHEAYSMIESKNLHGSKKFQKDLKRILSEYATALHVGAVQRLIGLLNISNMRIAQGNYVSLSMEVITALKESKYFQIAKELFQHQYLEQCSDEENQLQELMYLALHLMAEEKIPKSSKELHDFRKNMKENDDYLLPSLLTHFSDLVGFHLTDDDIFLVNMLQESKKISMANQFEVDTEASGIIQYHDYVENHPLFQAVEEILAATCSDRIEGEMRKEHTFNIFFLLQAAILRKKRKTSIRIALIGRTAVEMDYLSEALHSYLGNRVTISLLDNSMLEQINRYHQFDLLIATSRVDVSHVKHLPVMRVSSILTNSDLIEIENFVEDQFSYVLGLNEEMIYSSLFQENGLSQ